PARRSLRCGFSAIQVIGWSAYSCFPIINSVTNSSPEPPLFPQVLRLFAVVVLGHVAAQPQFADRRGDGDAVLLVLDALVVFHRRRGLRLDVDAAAPVAPAAACLDHAAGKRGGGDAGLA